MSGHVNRAIGKEVPAVLGAGRMWCRFRVAGPKTPNPRIGEMPDKTGFDLLPLKPF